MKLVTLFVFFVAATFGVLLEIEADEDFTGRYPFSSDRDDRSPTYWAQVISPT